jgi:excisionase family DNA binding protein
MADHRGSPLGWQIITLAGYQVYITVEMIQPGSLPNQCKGQRLLIAKPKPTRCTKRFWSSRPSPSSPRWARQSSDFSRKDRAMQKAQQQARKLLSIEEAMEVLGVGRTMLYRLMNEQALVSIKVGRYRKIPVYAVDEFIARRVEQE